MKKKIELDDIVRLKKDFNGGNHSFKAGDLFIITDIDLGFTERMRKLTEEEDFAFYTTQILHLNTWLELFS